MTNSAPNQPTTLPKVLLVDDEDGILATARRFFRGKQIEFHTCQSPTAALELVQKENFDVVISDYRMPEMTGTDLLEKVRKIKPFTSRLILTGYLEVDILQAAINRASIFRFLTKPWDESDLILGVEAAIQHSRRQKMNAVLISETGLQNQKLEELTTNLETEVFKRTQTIEQRREQAESKQRAVKELVGFVKNLSRASTVDELYESLHQEMWRFQGLSTLYFLILEGNEKGRILWNQARTLHEKHVENIPPHFLELSLRTSSPKDKKWWVDVFKKEPNQLIAIPVRGRESSQATPLGLIFADHNLKADKLNEFTERITERLQVVSIVLDKILLKEQLLSATLQWQATFSAFHDPIAVVDNQERVIRANKSFMKEDKKRCHEMFDDRKELCVGCPMPQALLTQAPSNSLVRTAKKNTFRVNSYPVSSQNEGDEKIIRVVNHYTDISRERELYMKLVQSEKLAAVGLLAGNIAHELNNPLSGLKAMGQILKKELPPADPHSQDIDEIDKAVTRCQSIIKNLLNFSESPQNEFEKTDLNDVIESTLPLLKTAIRNQQLHTSFDEKIKPVNGQPGQLQQVFFNLINNACQALPQGGVITVKTWQNKKFSCVSISDTGPGIPDEIKVRIFEPFFTTKETGKGTGLGLSVSQNIIEKHKGSIILESELGVGSTFIISIPSL